MNSIRTLKETLLKYMEDSRRFEQVKLTGEYPGQWREIPLRQEAIAVGVERLEMGAGGLGGYYGRQGGQEPLHGADALLTVRFDIYVPKQRPGLGCHRLYEELCELLLLEDEGPRFTNIWCERIRFDGQVGAHHLPAKASLRAVVAREGHTMAVKEYQLLYFSGGSRGELDGPAEPPEKGEGRNDNQSTTGSVLQL